ncbi:MAG: hypothetical protein PHT54_01795 [Candidatus Nanoarchaeia archaeon]|nr:hypothetical protein [Candidatus Nanoarchaeia archaeon]
MKKGFVKANAIFEIIILIFALFSVYSLKEVRAEDTGCCFLESEGLCSDNTSQSECSNKGGQFFSSPECSTYSKCQKGCCKIGDQCSFVSKYKCEATASSYSGIDYAFSEGGSETECTSSCEASATGCCLDEGCTYTTKNLCSGEFYDDQFCSGVSFCGCKKENYKQCSNGDVYWYDSCGNKENIVKKCDYASGLKCRDENGKVDCYTLDCETTYKDENTKDTGVMRKNGESWCVYDSASGPGLDAVGSRHYRHICIDGVEIEEPCEDYRNEICMYADVNVNGQTFREAACKENRYDKCMSDCNTAYELLPKTYDDDDAFNQEIEDYTDALIADKKCCEKTDKDCYWLSLSSGLDEETIAEKLEGSPILNDKNVTEFPDLRRQIEMDQALGRCLPLVSSGNLGEESKNCEGGFNQALSVWESEAYSLGGEMYCAEGCSAYSDNWMALSNYICNSAGDCGAKYNWKGEFNGDGFVRNWEGAIEQPEDEFSNFIENFPELKEMPKKNMKENLFPIESSELFQDVKGLYLGEINYEDFVSSASSSGSEGVNFELVMVRSLGVAGIGVSLAAAFFHLVYGVELLPAFFGSSNVVGIGELLGLGPILGPVVVAVVVAAAVLTVVDWFMSTDESRMVTTVCSAWQAPDNGDNCEKCGLVDGEYGKFKECSKYKCESLGTQCEFIEENAGTDRPMCVKLEQKDITSPVITAWPENLTKGYKLAEDGRGFKITPDVTAYTRLNVGIKTNKIAQCKFSEDPSTRYDAMVNYFGEGYYDVKHSLSILAEPGKKYILYVRCKGKSSNANEVPYTIKFNTKEGPDLTAPIIEASDPKDNSFVPYSLKQIGINVYTNEPTKCKYSDEGKEYGEMLSETSCSKNDDKYICKINVDLEFKDNKVSYYFKCMDSSGNVNQDSYLINLKESPSELTIDDYTPKETSLYKNTFTLNVATSGGAENGKAECEYNGIKFKETNSNLHSQEFKDVAMGSYDFKVECEDVAGNKATKEIKFAVTKDVNYPVIVRLYKKDDTLHVELDEDAECEYSTEDDFSFGSGEDTDKVDYEHMFVVENNRYYLICKDGENNLSPVYSINV